MNHRGLAAAVVLGSLLGCINSDPGNPNGKLGVLFFYEEASRIGVGLSEQILLPNHVVLGGGPKSTDRTKTFDYDFTGTTLDATGANGLAALGATLGDTGWALQIRCDAPANVPSELHVRVMVGATARYEDAYDVTCRGPGQLSIVQPAAPARVAVGATVLVEQRLALVTVMNEQPELPSNTNHAHAQAVTRCTGPRIQLSRTRRCRRTLRSRTSQWQRGN